MATLDRALERGKPRSRMALARRQAGLLFVLPSVLFMAVFCGPWTRRILTGRFVTAIGGMCYSIYLVHFVVSLTLGRATEILATRWYIVNLGLQALLLGVPIMAVSTLFYLAVEGPCMEPKWLKHAVSRLRRWIGPPRIPILQEAESAASER